MDILEKVLILIWLVLPAYVANGAPVVGVKILDKLGYRRHPIDRGKHLFDGKRIFGDNKTWEGFLIGIASGTLAGVVQQFLGDFDYIYIARGVALSIGAMVGDLLGAFIKRRLGIKPGDPLPFIDQTSFLYVALLVALPLNLLNISFIDFLILTIVTVFLHVLTNFVAYKLKLKHVPW
jgi:CDP-2,3-bis-(O-geranylgeranyl)-sn-glycerol synthase